MINLEVELTEPLEKALAWAIEHYPDASMKHQAAFANAVAYLVTGASGGYGGPSMREHLVSWIVFEGEGSLSYPGQWEYEKALIFAAPLCFDPPENYLELLRAIAANEFCFDDDIQDLNAVLGKVIKVPYMGFALEPAQKLTPSLTEYVLKQARILQELKSHVRLCHGRVNDYVVCGVPMVSHAKGDYCHLHRGQDPARQHGKYRKI